MGLLSDIAFDEVKIIQSKDCEALLIFINGTEVNYVKDMSIKINADTRLAEFNLTLLTEPKKIIFETEGKECHMN
ncbi:MAG: hypothetical protein ACRDBM_15830 [Sporomusa sp.]